ncbi:MAG: hypothetical protein M1616_04335 [Candidatus Thermoplasmatota archaeon]|nr:hypothetical protein [Candidatus Thermoplasmatota archaeon]
MAKLRELEKFENNALDLCKDEQYREKLKKWVQKKKEPLDAFGLKKLKDKIDTHARKMNR